MKMTVQTVSLSEDYYPVCYPSEVDKVTCKMLQMTCGAGAPTCLDETSQRPSLAVVGSSWEQQGNCPAYAMSMTRVSPFGVDDSDAVVLLCISSSAEGSCEALKCAISTEIAGGAASGFSFPNYENDWKVML